MKKLIITVSAFLLFSCSKTIILSDGINSKKIKSCSIVTVKEGNINFRSEKGTLYTINLTDYNYIIK
jgi:hypothetical protein